MEVEKLRKGKTTPIYKGGKSCTSEEFIVC